MPRVLGVVAGLLWVAGIVVLSVGATQVNAPLTVVEAKQGIQYDGQNVLNTLFVYDHVRSGCCTSASSSSGSRGC